jgi:beta-lysine 5,6-aminomutase beta subunit
MGKTQGPEQAHAQPDLTSIKPYGDTLNDGAVQLSFTLPVPSGQAAQAAAVELCRQMGLDDPTVVHMKDMGENFTFFVVYGSLVHTVDYTEFQVPELVVGSEALGFDEVNEQIRQEFGRQLVVVGACTGTDAHTVGLDAIMNMKGYAGEYGLERYPMFRTFNLGSQVSNARLVAEARRQDADAVLVSQVVTQKQVHIPNLTELVDLLEAEGMREDVVLICGGPRVNHELAIELGYDAGFGPGTTPDVVATFIVEKLAERLDDGA